MGASVPVTDAAQVKGAAGIKRLKSTIWNDPWLLLNLIRGSLWFEPRLGASAPAGSLGVERGRCRAPDRLPAAELALADPHGREGGGDGRGGEDGQQAAGGAAGGPAQAEGGGSPRQPDHDVEGPGGGQGGQPDP